MNDNDTLADDLRKDSMALMKLLADEKHKSEALAAELANEQKDRANADKVGLQYLSRIRELEALCAAKDKVIYEYDFGSTAETSAQRDSKP